MSTSDKLDYIKIKAVYQKTHLRKQPIEELQVFCNIYV